MPPTRTDLQALATRALAHLDAEAQATVWWERRLAVGEHGVSDLVQHTAEVVVLHEGRVGAASTTDLGDAGLRGAAAAALAHARLAADLADAAGDGLAIELRAGAARAAIVSTRGVDAFEERSFASAEVHAPGRPIAAVTHLDQLDIGALVAAAEAGFHDGAPQAAQAGAPPVVLGPVAVAQALELLKPELAGRDSLIAARHGATVAAPGITLADAARQPGTLPRSYDAEGVPRSHVPLIQDGVARRPVADTASGGSTGHATRPGHAEPWPDHLVLEAGDADDLAALAAPIAQGLLIPAFLVTERGWLLDGARLIERGEPTWAVNGTADVDPVELLATAEALTRGRQLVPTDDDSALTIGATLAPGVRARAGVTIVG